MTDCTHCKSHGTVVKVAFNNYANAVFAYCRHCEKRSWIDGDRQVSLDQVVERVREQAAS